MLLFLDNGMGGFEFQINVGESCWWPMLEKKKEKVIGGLARMRISFMKDKTKNYK